MRICKKGVLIWFVHVFIFGGFIGFIGIKTGMPYFIVFLAAFFYGIISTCFQMTTKYRLFDI